MEHIFDKLNCGDVRWQPFAKIDGKRVVGDLTSTVGTAEYRQLHFTAAGAYKDDFYFTSTPEGWRCRRAFTNLSGATMKLNEIGIAFSGFNFGGKSADDFFYHVENARIFEQLTTPVDKNPRFGVVAKQNGAAFDTDFDETAGQRWGDPGVITERVGDSPYQPFPAFLVANYGTRRGVVFGSLSQKIFYHCWWLKHDENRVLQLEFYSAFKDNAYLEIPNGATLLDEWYIGYTDHSDDIERIYDGYTAELRKVLPANYGATKINRDNLVWGSWNDGILRSVTEELILKEAAYLKKNFPTVRWIQLDDGYSISSTKCAHGLGVPYEGDAGFDRQKFPDGMRAYTDKIRALGLRPAVWIGGFCPKVTPIFKDHPDWFMDYDMRTDRTSPLDVSKPEVREYMTSALDTFFLKYGFEGVKHDFWSYAFEDSHNLHSNHTRSGYEYRRWWLSEIRKRLPGDGYFQTGCDLVEGNPFLGEYFTNYRYGCDIGSGRWEYVKVSFLWGVTCFATHTGDLFVPNSDSIGLYPGLNDNEAMFAMNFSLVTHSMVEIAGKLSENPDSPRLPRLKKAACNPNNGQDIYFARYDYRRDLHPAIVYFKTGHFCPNEDQAGLPIRSVGLFNVDETAKKVSFAPADLGLPDGEYLLTDVWGEEKIKFSGEVSIEVAAHGSRLFAVNPVAEPQLLDADIRIVSATRRDGKLVLRSDYANRAELRFSVVPSQITINGTAVEFKTADPLVARLDIPAQSEVAVEF